jgi:hypothetical protein
MYELRSGSKRIVRALRDVQYDDTVIANLTRILNYVTPDQLREDIRALDDYMDMIQQKEQDEE